MCHTLKLVPCHALRVAGIIELRCAPKEKRSVGTAAKKHTTPAGHIDLDVNTISKQFQILYKYEDEFEYEYADKFEHTYENEFTFRYEQI